jgi:hypothetical protein
MRILSKYKDYYDYYTGIYGIDNNRVYDRRKVLEFDRSNSVYDTDYGILTFAICGTLYTIYIFNGEFYHTPEELENLDSKLEELNFRRYNKFLFSFRNHELKKDENPYEKEYNLTNNVPTDINIKRREPVLVDISHPWHNRELESKDFSVPLLESFEFYKILDPKEIYIKIETFLGWLVDNPPLPDTQTNIGKVESHGFDKKRSFRPKMK